MKKHLRDELIILKRITVNENDVILYALGKYSGKISVKANGGKKILSKFTGRLEPLTSIEAEIYDSGKSYTLTAATIKSPAPETLSIKGFNVGQEICRILFKTLPEKSRDVAIFNLLKNTIEILKDNQKEDEVILAFYAKYLKLSGHMPTLNVCTDCGEKIESEIMFDHECNVFCWDCKKVGTRIERNSLKTINFYASTSDFRNVTNLKINQNIKDEIIVFLNKMMLGLYQM